MGNQFRVEVRESSEELQHRLRYAVTAATKERVQMQYLGSRQGRMPTARFANATKQEVSQRLGRDESTVSHLDGTCFQDFLDLFWVAYPDALNLIQMDFWHFTNLWI
ncbi:hypothetical protein [Nostoc sp.]|uniref:hypothetical protein n=1 Tax=Nostoc sp. TaxID=1180 RepID=UPI002FFB7F1C